MTPGHAAFERLVAGVDAYIAQDVADRASRPVRKADPKPKPVKALLTPAERSARTKAGIAKRRLGYQPKSKKAKVAKPKKPKLTPEERSRAVAAGWARKRDRAKAEREVARQAEQQQ